MYRGGTGAVTGSEGDAVGNSVPHPFFYSPVVLDGRVRTILQVWLKQAGDPRSYADIAAFLDGLAHHACLYLAWGHESALLHRDTKSPDAALAGGAARGA